MARKYLEGTQERISEIFNTYAHSTDSAIMEFIRQLYSLVPDGDIEDLTTEELYNLAIDTFKFAEKRRVNCPIIRVFNATPENNNWRSQYTIIEMVNDDMPFLVDSVLEEVGSVGLKLYRIMHPVIGVSRDPDGKLIEIHPGDKQSSDVIKSESLIHLQVTYIAEEEERNKLASDLEEILAVVRLAVDDWRSMLGKADDTLHDIEKIASSTAYNDPVLKEHIIAYGQETKAFMKWLRDGNFILLGYIEYRFHETNNSRITITSSAELGIFKSIAKFRPQGLEGLSQEALRFVKSPNILEITKASTQSVVHRRVPMDYIGVKKFDENGNIIGERRFIGLFTSIVYYQSGKLIPFIRQKMDYVIHQSPFKPTSHNGKALVATLEAFPRDELFQIDEKELFDTCMGIVSLSTRPRVKLFIRKDKFHRFFSCIIFVPKEAFSTQLREKIQDILTSELHGKVVNHYTSITEAHLARLHVIVRLEDTSSILPYEVERIEKRVSIAASSWYDELREMLVSRKGENEGERLFQKYEGGFQAAYANRFAIEMACRDIDEIELVLDKGHIIFNLYRHLGIGGDHLYDHPADDSDVLQLKIYSPLGQLHLSEIMPTMENLGLQALDSQTFEVKLTSLEKVVWLHHFHFRLETPMSNEELREIKRNFELALNAIWNKEIEDDEYNTLIIKAGLNYRDVTLIRGYGKYLKQTGFSYGQDYIASALAKHPGIIKKITTYFKELFDPTLHGDRKLLANATRKEIVASLNAVENVAEDKILRRYVDVIDATLRTNYFQHDSAGHVKPYISFKLNSRVVPDLPKPRPFVEIFVYSRRVEGIHLRGGEVARGGLRWSDRPEDFRIEVLGLMKAQMTKNAVIVPVGSKGGFVVKHPPAPEAGRDAFIAEGIECYKIFLRGLLDITDNYDVNSNIIVPKEVIRHDGDDPYLVVAADKGTATFSDIANSVSKDYHFWLGDAFASGGSAGYDHKKMGITARGAWVSVRRHFSEMGTDIQKEDFSVIGIGDMSGDVFGNGMLRSEHIKLVAAFNHLHIFLDPNPDPKKSFEERARLFDLPRSTWSDYNKDLISSGGGIFERKSKSIPLSKEVQALTGLSATQASPDELIQALLKAPVDLLWNGGIGTYVKAEAETNDVVGDKTNDALRVNGAELRCKVVGEGGNLGFTQRGRIEYALQGGRINTDAIDNSAGVDCSDHEVNIKIAFGSAVASKKITLEERDVILSDMTESVAELVLRDNHLQVQAISIAEHNGLDNMELYQRLMHHLEDEGLLDRRVEYLPDDEVLARRASEKKPLTRPELAVLLSYSKMSIYNDLLASNLPDDPYLSDDLKRYFPPSMAERFESEILNHQLRREIIVTFATNSIVNRVGCTFFHHVMEDTGMKGCDIARAYIITRDVFGLRNLWLEIEKLDGQVSSAVQIKLFKEVQSFTEQSTLWFLRNLPQPLQMTNIVHGFFSGVQTIASCLEDILTPHALDAMKDAQACYVEHGVPELLARKVAGLEALSSACDIVQVTRSGNLSLESVGRIYFALGSRLNVEWLRIHVNQLSTDTYWQRLSRKTLSDDLFDQQRRITSEVIKFCETHSITDAGQAMENWFAMNSKEMERYHRFIQDLRTHDIVTPPMLVVAVKRVESLCIL